MYGPLMASLHFKVHGMEVIPELRRVFGEDGIVPKDGRQVDEILTTHARGRLVGFVGWLHCPAGDGFQESVCLTCVDVHPGWREQGVGSRMLWKTLTVLKQRHIWRYNLMVRTLNQIAIRLYHKLGFRITDRVPDFYEDGADGFEMERITRRQVSEPEEEPQISADFVVGDTTFLIYTYRIGRTEEFTWQIDYDDRGRIETSVNKMPAEWPSRAEAFRAGLKHFNRHLQALLDEATDRKTTAGQTF